MGKENKIVYNAIFCNSCGDRIASENRHDFKMCKCGKVGVDGGHEYLRRIGEDYKDVSILTNDIHIAREYLKRNGTTLLKDMDTDWVRNVIIYEEEHRPNNPFLYFYREELKLRE